MDTKARIVNNRIGEVEIYEMLGSLKGSSSRKFLMETKNLMNTMADPFSALFNTQGLREMDESGAEAILTTSEKAKKCVVVTRDTHTAELLLRHHENRVCIFEKPEEAIFFLRYELAGHNETDSHEQRRHPRIQVALPVKVTLPRINSADCHCVMVATNLSFSGMFLQFMDSAAEFEVRRSINLGDLPELDFQIRLGARDHVKVKGHIMHVGLSQHRGIGVSFSEMTEPSEWVLRKFLEGFQKSSSPSPDGDISSSGGSYE